MACIVVFNDGEPLLRALEFRGFGCRHDKSVGIDGDV